MARPFCAFSPSRKLQGLWSEMRNFGGDRNEKSGFQLDPSRPANRLSNRVKHYSQFDLPAHSCSSAT